MIKCTLNFSSDFEIFLDLSSLDNLTLFISSILNVLRDPMSILVAFTYSNFTNLLIYYFTNLLIYSNLTNKICSSLPL